MLSLCTALSDKVIMRYLIWSLRAVLFLLLLGFAVKNDQPVVLRYFFGYEWQTSLVVVLLCFFTHRRRASAYWPWWLRCSANAVNFPPSNASFS